jgi:hypothetical protein
MEYRNLYQSSCKGITFCLKSKDVDLSVSASELFFPILSQNFGMLKKLKFKYGLLHIIDINKAH